MSHCGWFIESVLAHKSTYALVTLYVYCTVGQCNRNIFITLQRPNFLLTQLNSEYKLTLKHHRFSHGTVDSVMGMQRTVNRIKHDESDWIPTVADQVLDSSARVIREVRQRRMWFTVLYQIPVNDLEWLSEFCEECVCCWKY